MNETRISFSSYSRAAAAYDYLKANNIKAQIIRTPPRLNGSCGYSLQIDSRNSAAARDLLSHHRNFSHHSSSDNLHFIHS